MVFLSSESTRFSMALVLIFGESQHSTFRSSDLSHYYVLECVCTADSLPHFLDLRTKPITVFGQRRYRCRFLFLVRGSKYSRVSVTFGLMLSYSVQGNFLSCLIDFMGSSSLSSSESVSLMLSGNCPDTVASWTFPIVGLSNFSLYVYVENVEGAP